MSNQKFLVVNSTNDTKPWGLKSLLILSRELGRLLVA